MRVRTYTHVTFIMKLGLCKVRLDLVIDFLEGLLQATSAFRPKWLVARKRAFLFWKMHSSSRFPFSFLAWTDTWRRMTFVLWLELFPYSKALLHTRIIGRKFVCLSAVAAFIRTIRKLRKLKFKFSKEIFLGGGQKQRIVILKFHVSS